MSTIVYHQQGNLQSCFEPQIFEMTATLKLKVPPSSPPPCQEVKDFGGWSMLQSLSGIISKDAAAAEKEAAYVHPMARRQSSSRLSEKSLALCTEALGSETGTDMTEISSIFSSALASPEPTSRQEESLPPWLTSSQQQIESRNVTSAATAAAASAYRSMNNNSSRNSRNNNNNNNFPPPLTTISGGANSLLVRPHREGGRLIIRAVETPSKRTYLQAERSNGRLRLSFFKADFADRFDHQITTSEESDGDSEEFKDDSDELEGDINGEDELKVAEVQELEEDEEEEEESDVYMARDMDGNTSNVEVEMGITKCLLGRCKETGGHSNKGLSQWGEPKTLWVST